MPFVGHKRVLLAVGNGATSRVSHLCVRCLVLLLHHADVKCQQRVRSERGGVGNELRSGNATGEASGDASVLQYGMDQLHHLLAK